VPERSLEVMTATSSEFGATLRSWRDRLTPEAVGLPSSARRRAPGLRRQEVAQLAGVSLDYLVQLEQGRSIVPSPQVLAALARALRLSETERIHLFQLAGQLVPDGRRIHDTPPDSLRRLVDQLSASPAAV
jgi:transcriptional regulator with XRE-family HTH domain